MALLLSFLPIIKFFSLLAPTIVSFFILFASILNQDLKGVIYLSGLILTLLIGILLKPFFSGLIPEKAHVACNIFSDAFPNSNYSNPSLDTLSLVFTIVYMVSPMIHFKTINWTIIISLLFVTFLNGLFRLRLNCNRTMDIVIALLVGTLCGIGYFSLVNNYEGSKYLYFTHKDSNNVVCNKPTDQKFKCVVYKNGKVIQQL